MNTQENKKHIVVKFFAPVVEKTANDLMNTIDQLVNQGEKEVTLLLSTPGGSVFHGLSIYNYLKGIPITIKTHNFGSVDSIGVVIYCAGGKRYSSPQARFLLHGAAANFEKCRLEEPQLEEALKGLKMDIGNIARVIAINSGKGEEEVVKAMLERTTLNPEEAKKWGLVHEIKSEMFLENSQVISINFNQPNQ